METAAPRYRRLQQRFNEYRQWVRRVHEQTGKNGFAQAREIAALKNAGGQCGISNYYWFRLYDDEYLHGRGWPDFLGWQLKEKFSLALNPRYAVLPAWDKFAFIAIASAYGLPIAPVLAHYHRAGKPGDALGRHLPERGAVAAFLRDPERYPLFGKPGYSQQGYGSVYLTAYHPEQDCVQSLDGSRIPVNDFLDRLERSVDPRYHKPECGYLFQKPLTQAPEIQALVQWPAISGVRVICLNGPEGVQPIRAIWRIAMPPNHVDNFSLGKYGNLLADVDLATGCVSRVATGLWPAAKLLDSHPNTGKTITGFHLPGWRHVLDACRLGGAIFPLMKIQHWDFALTNRGPRILELNDIGATELAQVHGRGLLTEPVREFLKRHADLRQHRWIAAL